MPASVCGLLLAAGGTPTSWWACTVLRDREDGGVEGLVAPAVLHGELHLVRAGREHDVDLLRVAEHFRALGPRVREQAVAGGLRAVERHHAAVVARALGARVGTGVRDRRRRRHEAHGRVRVARGHPPARSARSPAETLVVLQRVGVEEDDLVVAVVGHREDAPGRVERDAAEARRLVEAALLGPQPRNQPADARSLPASSSKRRDCPFHSATKMRPSWGSTARPLALPISSASA